jgi:alkylhydroperoxidase/carboxymuconolactone decarboxylase family protein
MPKHYFEPADLAKFGDISKWQKPMGDKYFAWYGEVMKEGALTEREKALIALAVAHAIQCPYCIDAYTTTTLEKGADEEQMMEAVQVAAVIRAGSSLVYGVQMMNHAEEITMK